MTKLEELKITRADAGYAADVCAADATYDNDARADAQAAVDAVYDAARADAWFDYEAELKKTQEENYND